jgi:ribosomal protein S18 acetylase RimI-like enzyme
VTIRVARSYEKQQVVEWVRRSFGEPWADECDAAFGNRPVSCFIATENGAIAGFACYDATCRDFFGPAGVADQARGRGIGSALLLTCLHAMAAIGYGYAIIGGAGSLEFYRKVVAAIEIEGSSPGIYRDRLKPRDGTG